MTNNSEPDDNSLSVAEAVKEAIETPLEPLAIKLAEGEGCIVLGFSQSVKWIGLPPNQALEIGLMLVEYGQRNHEGDSEPQADPAGPVNAP